MPVGLLCNYWLSGVSFQETLDNNLADISPHQFARSCGRLTTVCCLMCINLCINFDLEYPPFLAKYISIPVIPGFIRQLIPINVIFTTGIQRGYPARLFSLYVIQLKFYILVD